MDITGYEDRTRGFNSYAIARCVVKKQVSPWWCYSNDLMPFNPKEIESMDCFDPPSMDAPDILPSGGMKSLSFGGRQVIVNSREWLKTPFEDAIDAAFPND